MEKHIGDGTKRNSDSPVERIFASFHSKAVGEKPEHGFLRTPVEQGKRKVQPEEGQRQIAATEENEAVSMDEN